MIIFSTRTLHLTGADIVANVIQIVDGDNVDDVEDEDEESVTVTMNELRQLC